MAGGALLVGGFALCSLAALPPSLVVPALRSTVERSDELGDTHPAATVLRLGVPCCERTQ